MIWLAAVVPAALIAAVGTVRWHYAVVTVYGPSMEPALADGDHLLAGRCRFRRLQRGQLVVFREPGAPGDHRPAWLTMAARERWVVKRVAAIPGDPVPDSVRPAVDGTDVVPPRAIVVLGDAACSQDSRHWGFIPASAILGVARRLTRSDN
jgi:signal peptidase I